MPQAPGDLLQPVAELAAEAGRRILEVYEGDFAVTDKGGAGPLTAADLASHRAIADGLAELDPATPVLSEEAATVPYETRRRWRRFWLVDPLDGTKEFVKRNGEFTVNIALIEGHGPVLGVVHVPVTGVTYLAARGRGACRRAPGRPAEPIHAVAPGGGPVRVVGSRSHAGGLLARYLEGIGEHEMVPMGSSLKLCLVAEGRADCYPRLGPTSEWDTAAAQCVVEEAGGRVVSVDGGRLAYNTKESLLNPHFLVFGPGDASRWTRPLAALA